MNKLLPILILASAQLLPAQEPPSHAVTFPSGDAAWTVKIEVLNKPAADPGVPLADPDAPAVEKKPVMRSVEVVQKGRLRRNLINWSDGRSTEYWWCRKPVVVLFRERASDSILSILPSQLGFRGFDASNFYWVNASTFRKEKTVKGKLIREYRIEIPFEDAVEEFTAQIDAETGNPLVWSNGTIRATFAFHDPPDGPLMMPEDFQAALNRIAQIEAPAKRTGKR